MGQVCRPAALCAVVSWCARAPAGGVCTRATCFYEQRVYPCASLWHIPGGAAGGAACDLQRHSRGWSHAVQTVAKRVEWHLPPHMFQSSAGSMLCCHVRADALVACATRPLRAWCACMEIGRLPACVCESSFPSVLLSTARGMAERRWCNAISFCL